MKIARLPALLVLFLVSACAPQNIVATSQPLVPGLVGEYFNNFTMNGLPNAVRIDPQLNFTWEDASPMVGIAGDFSARWTGYILAPTTDYYVFRLDADDGVRFTIDGYEVVDDWARPTFSHLAPAILLEEGRYYPIEIDFYDNGGAAHMELRWSTVSNSLTEEFVPKEVFFSDDKPFPPISSGQPDGELCVVSVDSIDDQWIAGTPVAPEVVIAANTEEAKKTLIIDADIEGVGEVGVYRILVIPVGYDTQDEIRLRASILEDIFVDQLEMNVSFTYLQKDFPIPVSKHGNLIDIEDDVILALRDKVRSLEGPDPHLFLFDVNAEGRGLHSWAEDQEFIILQSDAALYAGVHELGHAFGLDDGYQATFYSQPELLQSTELFLADATGQPIIPNSEWKQWIDEQHVRFVATSFTCMGQPVLQMELEEYSIMDSWWADEEIITDEGALNEWVFTPFQLWVMRTTLDEILKEKP